MAIWVLEDVSARSAQVEAAECAQIASYIDVAVRNGDTPRVLTGLYTHAERDCSGDRLLKSMGVSGR